MVLDSPVLLCALLRSDAVSHSSQISPSVVVVCSLCFVIDVWSRVRDDDDTAAGVVVVVVVGPLDEPLTSKLHLMTINRF